ncbi:MAG: hypothetical protein JWR22_4329, partial [Herminiimonas sp.]|nr:hypothetical protein [Herminiimonas sp.]
IQSSTLTLTSGEGDNVLTINIRNASQEARILVPATSSLGLSIEITNAKVKQHDEAVDLLQQIANSLFFSIDLQKGTYLSLIRNPSRERRDRPHANDLEIHFPRHVYDKAPMDLYWYARSATNMPLLQFLAYYQVLEYYYPVFFNADISRRIRAQIKNPAFRVDSESDISRVVSTIKTKGPGSGSEREQLKATLRECIENDDIHDFVNQSPQRAAFFNSKAKGITANLLNTANKTTELYIQAAERIYSIRCKIVHTKSDDHEGEIELLLPYSKEAEKLGEDIELVKFVAQKVMVYSSKEVPIV